jgi:hypothetical protein
VALAAAEKAVAELKALEAVAGLSPPPQAASAKGSARLAASLAANASRVERWRGAVVSYVMGSPVGCSTG